jgi:hypothetical protein
MQRILGLLLECKKPVCELGEFVGLGRIDQAGDVEIEEAKVAAGGVESLGGLVAAVGGVVRVVWEIGRDVDDGQRVRIQWERRVGRGERHGAVGGRRDGHGCMHRARYVVLEALRQKQRSLG